MSGSINFNIESVWEQNDNFQMLFRKILEPIIDDCVTRALSKVQSVSIASRFDYSWLLNAVII